MCISKRPSAHMRKKIRCRTMRILESLSHIKRGRGESSFAPHGLPFRYERCITVVAHCNSLRLRRQNLAALGTAAGENLAAVGSSHSLTETVDLGSVATAGLIGTLHGIHLLSNSHMLDSQIGRSNTYLPTIHIDVLVHYNRKFPEGQHLFVKLGIYCSAVR